MLVQSVGKLEISVCSYIQQSRVFCRSQYGISKAILRFDLRAEGSLISSYLFLKAWYLTDEFARLIRRA